MFAASSLPNRENRLRTGIVLSGKHVDTAIDRNFFRRRFYDTLAPLCDQRPLDLVVRAKKGVKLARRDEACVASFDRDLAALISSLPSS
jgi:RNase P protein component